MMKTILPLLAVVSLSLCAGAAPVFFDDFNTENGGAGVLNYAGFANWTVSDGTVDLIGNGFYDFLPGNGLYVDMDGSTSNAGKMLTTQAISLGAGTYELSYELAGNHRNAGVETVDVAVNVGIFSASHSLSINDPFTLFTQQFTLATAQDVTISFEGIGRDNIGMLMDNVKLDNVTPPTVPAPAAILLAGMGTGLVGWLRRRRAL
jgi:hypothetical protein